jgi:hypothetical protein
MALRRLLLSRKLFESVNSLFANESEFVIIGMHLARQLDTGKVAWPSRSGSFQEVQSAGAKILQPLFEIGHTERTFAKVSKIAGCIGQTSVDDISTDRRLRARRAPFGLPPEGALGSGQEPTPEQSECRIGSTRSMRWPQRPLG